ncbi:MAG TPA: hypothetical protein PKY82_05310 [Pyrinomonadaceae bacterium]|nr:hypothetical protein [Pyrinomonadaceae bacterium]
MSNKNLTNESKFRQFLLDEMPEEERVDFEQNFILDEEMFENLRVAEDELIENYVRGNLSGNDRQKFETKFLTNEKRHERVAFTRAMLKNFANQSALKKQEAEGERVSVWASLVSFFKQPQFALGSAFAVLLLLLGGWFLLRKTEKPIDIVQNTPTPIPQISVTPTPQTSENTNNTPNQNVVPINQRPKVEPTLNKTPDNTNLQKPVQTPSNPVITTLALFTGGVRSEGKTNELNLPKNSGGANLQLNLESQDYKIYRAEIVDQNGKIIYQSGKLSANKSKVNAFVPVQNLKRGDYIIKLYGKNANNQDESVADFQFRVNQK